MKERKKYWIMAAVIAVAVGGYIEIDRRNTEKKVSSLFKPLDNRKTCPKCKEKVNEQASRCKHCLYEGVMEF